MLSAVQSLPVRSALFCKKHSISPRALAITAVVLIAIGAAIACRIPPFSTFGIKPGLPMLVLGTLAGALAIYAVRNPIDKIYPRKKRAAPLSDNAVPQGGLFVHTRPGSPSGPVPWLSGLVLQTLLRGLAIYAVRNPIDKTYLRKKGAAILFDNAIPQDRQLARNITPLLHRLGIHTGSLIEIFRDGIKVDGYAILNPLNKIYLRKKGAAILFDNAIPQDRQLARNITPLLHRFGIYAGSSIEIFRDGIRVNGEEKQIDETGRALLRAYFDIQKLPSQGVYIEITQQVLSQETDSPLLNLPEELLMKILSLLSQKERLKFSECHPTLYRLAYDRTWRIEFHVPEGMSPEVVHRVLCRHRQSMFAFRPLLASYVLRFSPYDSSRRKELDFSKICIATDEAQTLFDNIRQFTDLQYLNFEGCLPRGFQISLLTNLFTYTPHIMSLDLSENKVRGERIRALANSFHHIPKLERLYLSACRLFDGDLEVLVEKFRDISKLRDLDLTFNKRINDRGARALVTHFCDIPDLQILSLTGCSIGANGITAIKNNLSRLKKFECLNLKLPLGFHLIIHRRSSRAFRALLRE